MWRATVVTNLLVAFCGMSVCLFVCLPATSVCPVCLSALLHICISLCMYLSLAVSFRVCLFVWLFFAFNFALLLLLNYCSFDFYCQKVKKQTKNWLKKHNTNRACRLFFVCHVCRVCRTLFIHAKFCCVCVYVFFTFTLLVKKCNKCFLMDSDRQPTHPAGMAVGQKFNFNLFTL